MKMPLPVSVLMRELRTRPRRKRFYLKRTAFVLLGCLVMGYVVGFGILTGGSTTAGLQVFVWLAGATLLAMSVLPMISAASSIAEEKDDKTLGLLLLTDISGEQFVLGKLATTAFSTLMTILSAVPLFMLAVSLGGVSAPQILSASAVILGTMLLSSCIGLFIGAVLKSENGLGAGVLLGVVGMFAMFPWLTVLLARWIANGAFSFKGPSVPTWFLNTLSPFIAMGTALEGVKPGMALLNTMFCVAAASLFLLLAFRQIPRWLRRSAKPDAVRTAKGVLRSLRRARGSVSMPPVWSGNPVAWKDFYLGHGGFRGGLVKFGFTTGGLSAAVLLISLYLKASFDAALIGTGITAVVFSGAVWFLGVLHGCSGAFTGEKRWRTLEPLLLSDMTDGQILAGKARSCLMSVLPWFVCAAAGGLIILIVAIVDEPTHAKQALLVAALIAAEGFAVLFGLSCMCLWLSLRYKKSRGLALSLLVIVLWNTIGRSPFVFSHLFLPRLGRQVFEHLGPFAYVAVDVIVFAAAGAFFLARLRHHFRDDALRAAEM